MICPHCGKKIEGALIKSFEESIEELEKQGRITWGK